MKVRKVERQLTMKLKHHQSQALLLPRPSNSFEEDSMLWVPNGWPRGRHYYVASRITLHEAINSPQPWIPVNGSSHPVPHYLSSLLVHLL